MKDKLSVSFSGGRTSAFMARWLQLNVSDKYDLLYIFANTGCEHEKTLEFVQRCDDEWGLGIHWVEAVVHHGERKGCTHKYVDFDTASRNGEPMEAIISKYGLPNQAFPHCNRETKLNPIRSCLREKGFQKAWTAIGIRSDEMDRMIDKRKASRIVYPLIEWYPATKDQILEWWRDQPFDLEIPEHHGNCTWCWKKSDRKLLTNIIDHPEWFEFPKQMEHLFSKTNNRGVEYTIFRKNRSTLDLIELAKEPFEPFYDGMVIQPGLFGPLDEAGGCSESCDIYAD